jgi:hypothetical protein
LCYVIFYYFVIYFYFIYFFFFLFKRNLQHVLQLRRW